MRQLETPECLKKMRAASAAFSTHGHETHICQLNAKPHSEQRAGRGGTRKEAPYVVEVPQPNGVNLSEDDPSVRAGGKRSVLKQSTLAVLHMVAHMTTCPVAVAKNVD